MVHARVAGFTAILFRTRFIALLGALALALAACGGGQAGAVMPVSANLPAHASNGASSASFVIAIPSKATAAKLRRPRWVSPNSASIQMLITPNAGCGTACTQATTTNAGLTPSSPNCSASPSGTTCTFPLALLPGSYTATIAIYDGPLDANNAPTGQILSHNQSVPIQILQGVKTVVNATLAGIPALTVFKFIGGQGRFDPNSQRLVITAPGGSAQILPEVIDNDANVMIGPGAPTVTVAPVTSGPYTGQQDPSTGIVTITGPSTAIKQSVTFTAVTTSPDCTSIPSCSAPLTVGPEVYLAIADTGLNQVVVVNPTSASTAPVATIPGVIGSSKVAFAPNGDLFVPQNFLPYSVSVYAPPYTGAPIAVITNGVNNPHCLVVAPNGDLFVGNFGNATVTRYTAPYTAAPASITTLGVNDPESLAIDPAGTLLVANYAGSTVTEYPAPFASPSRTISQGISGPISIAIAGGEILVANALNGKLTSYPVASPSLLPDKTLAVGTQPMAVASFGLTIAVADYAANDVKILPFPYTLPAAFDYTANVNKPLSIASDAYGSFYTADSGANYVQVMSPPYNVSKISSYTTGFGPHGVAVWP